MKLHVYVDGFNLYYRALKGTPHRWLDLSKLCAFLLPKDQIGQIHYYTAPISAWPNDPDKPTRQQVYLRALRTIPNLSITYGQFRTHPVFMPSAADPKKKVEVIKTEEKGSDVNLATHLVYEGMKGLYEGAVLVSNDSDLAEPLRIAKEELKKMTGVLCPTKVPSQELMKHAVFYKRIRTKVLAASQFPPTLTDAHGTFHKPPSW